MLNIELMWKEYCHFEQGFQPNQAEKITSDRSREYTNAKKNARVLEPLVRALRRDKLPSPPRTLDEERHQVFYVIEPQPVEWDNRSAPDLGLLIVIVLSNVARLSFV